MHMSNNELIIMIIIIEKVCPNEMQTLCIAAISTKDYIYPLPSDRQHPSYSDCVEVKSLKGNIIRTALTVVVVVERTD